jgi:hypothetical protein
MKIDLKSALFGLVLGVLAMFAIGATNGAGDSGRYRLAGGPSYALIIDSQTGKVWSARYITTADIKGTDADFYSPKIDK